jgi:hypothetical protein
MALYDTLLSHYFDIQQQQSHVMYVVIYKHVAPSLTRKQQHADGIDSGHQMQSLSL